MADFPAAALDALAWTLIHFLWQGCAVALLYAAVRGLVPRTRSHLRYALGLLAMGALALVPACTFLLLLGGSESVPLVAATGVEVAASQATPWSLASMGAASSLAEWTVALWLAGVMLVALRSWLQWLELKRTVHRLACADRRLQAMLDALLARFGHAGPVRLLVSQVIETPTLIGWLRPVILVPAAVALRFPAAQLELILAHELGHLCRRDHLVNLLQAMVETLFFYHPVVHWIARDVRAEREICCDLLVLARMDGEPRVYARVLAELEELRQPPPRLALAANGGALLERVRRIVGVAPPEDASPLPRRMLLAVAVLLGVLAIGGWARMERAEPASVDAPLAWYEPVDMPVLAPPVDLVPAKLAPIEPVAAARVESTQEGPMADAPATLRAQAPAPPADGSADAAEGQRAPAPTEGFTKAPHASPAFDLAGHLAAPETAEREPVAVDAPARAAPAMARPVATRVIQPEYPAAAHSAVAERVELRFGVAANGAVDNIEVLAAPRNRAYARAAERALGKWRFDPASVVPGASYRQTFVFSMPGQALDDSQGSCGRVTGSMLCRRTESEAAPAGNATAAAALPGRAGSAGS